MKTSGEFMVGQKQKGAELVDEVKVECISN